MHIDLVNHRGIDFHRANLDFPLLVVEIGEGRFFRRAFAALRALREQAHLLRSREPLPRQNVVAVIVFPGMPGYRLIRRLYRPVRRRE